MEIFALIGHSGTGKSHHASVVAHQNHIEYIIDDGLLIKGSMVLSGHSAKRENTRFAAVKRAVFNDLDHARKMQNTLEELRPERLLILSTSHRMAQVITERLGLPKPTQYIAIEEIASPESIQTALKLRKTENMHVIPLPTFAIKKDFPGYLVDPLRSFFSLPTSHHQPVTVERSIVRPVYSSLGTFYIAEHVVIDLVTHIAAQIPGIHKTSRIEIKTTERKVMLNVDLVLALPKIPGGKLVPVLKKTQREFKEQIEYLTGFYLSSVNVTAKKLHMGQEPTAAAETAAAEATPLSNLIAIP